MSLPSPEQGQLAEFVAQHYPLQPVDAQFNISPSDGGEQRGHHLIASKTGRLYITEGSDPLAERQVQRRISTHAILELEDREGDITVYKVPNGTKLLRKMLERPVFSREYTDNLATRAGRFMGALRAIDPNLFGIRIDHLAAAPNVEGKINEDVRLIVIPPLVTVQPGVLPTDAELFESRGRSVNHRYLSPFLRGLRESS